MVERLSGVPPRRLSCFALARAAAILPPRQCTSASRPADACEREVCCEISPNSISDLACCGRVSAGCDGIAVAGQGDSGSTSGGNASRRQAVGKPLAPHSGRDGGGLQRGASGGFHGLARNSIRSDSAQQSSNGGASPASSGREGASGDRRLGQPVVPHSSHSGGGLQRGPSGDFHGLPGNSIGDSPPKQPRDPDASTASGGREEVFDDRWLGQPLDPNAESTFDVLQGDASGEFHEPNDTLTPSSSLGGDTTMSPLLQLRTSPPHGPDSQRGQVEIFSTDLSENLTQLARSGGVRTSTGVRVYSLWRRRRTPRHGRFCPAKRADRNAGE